MTAIFAFPFDAFMDDKEDRFLEDVSLVIPTEKTELRDESYQTENFLNNLDLGPAKETHSWDLGNIEPISGFEPLMEVDSANQSPEVEKPEVEEENRHQTGNTVKEWKAWTHVEEVFLVGAVMDRFFRRGSLSSTRGSDKNGSDDCWPCIKETYDRAWDKYCQINNAVQRPTERTANHLARRYKVMKIRLAANDIKGENNPSFREYYNEWENLFNINNCLLRKAPDSPSGRKRKVKSK